MKIALLVALLQFVLGTTACLGALPGPYNTSRLAKPATADREMLFNWYLIGICVAGAFAYGFLSGENAALTPRKHPHPFTNFEQRWVARFLRRG